jgi:hypothetical protein
MSTERSKAPVNHSAWNILGNPIFRRYCRSRLRLRGLGVALLITVLISGFVFFMFRSISLYRSNFVAVDAERAALIPLFILQAVILFVLGTAQVAGGMTAERDEGVIDYQRLVPMSPLAKVLGYLFGLPVREYLMFSATLPFTAWALWQGQVAASVWAPLYAALLSSTLLYHLTGLVTGTVVRNRRWAFLASIGLVFSLYTVVPQMAKFGLVFFKYLTITPVFLESRPGMVPDNIKAMLETVARLAPEVKFFNLGLSELVFTVFSQGGLILTFIVMLCRKWRRSESNLLGKVWATGFFIWIQVLLLGNALPTVDSGELFPSGGLRVFGRGVKMDPTGSEALIMAGTYGVVTLGLLFVLGGLITPSPERQVSGWRRARKRGERSMAVLGDAASGFWFVVVMALAGAGGWFLFTRGLIESRWFPGQLVPVAVLWIYAVVMLAAGVGFQVLMEFKGGRTVGIAAIFLGALPTMAGAVIGASSDRLLGAAVWLIGISPLSLPLYAPASVLELAGLPDSIALALPRAFYFWLFTGTLTSVWLMNRLRVARKAMARKILAEPVEGEADAARLARVRSGKM